MDSLKTRSFHGFSWSLIDTLVGSGISFIIGIVLARILSPSAFGIVGMVTVVMAISATIVDSGFSAGLIRKVVCTQEEYSTVFYFNIVAGISLYLVLFFSAPLIASFFKEVQLINILRVFGFVFVIDSFVIIQRVILIRNVNFKTQTVISIVSALISGFIGIYMAVTGYGVWSLAAQALIKQLINAVLLWVLVRWAPSFYFSVSIFKNLFEFGSKLLLTGLITTFLNNIYYIVIGRFFSAASVGYYTRAESLNAIVANNLTTAIEKVFFPVLSSIQTDSVRLKQVYKKIIKTSFFITFFALITLAVIAKPLIHILLGDKWHDSVILLQLICISTVFLPLNAVNLNMLKVKGESRLILNLQILKVILFIVLILAGIFWGIVPMLVARIAVTVIAYWINSLYSGKLVEYSMEEQIADILPYFTTGLFIAACMFSITFLNINNYLMIILQLISGAFLFFVIFEKKKFEEYLGIKEAITVFLVNKRIVTRNA